MRTVVFTKLMETLQINYGTAAYRPITKCFTTEMWRMTQTIRRLKHYKRRVSPRRPSSSVMLYLFPKFSWPLCSSCGWHQRFADGQRLSSYERKQGQTDQGKRCSSTAIKVPISCRKHVCITCLFLQEVLDLAFSITYDVEDSLNFIAPSRTDVSLTLGRNHSF